METDARVSARLPFKTYFKETISQKERCVFKWSQAKGVFECSLNWLISIVEMQSCIQTQNLSVNTSKGRAG